VFVLPDQITWAGRTLSGSDEFGEWVVTDLDGWFDSPESKGESQDREGQDGEFDLPIYNAARYITVTGHLHTKDHYLNHEAMSFLTGAMAGRFQVEGHGETLWADAKRNGKIKFTPITDTFAQWQVPLKCVKPYKYGETNTFTAAIGAPLSVGHRGNYYATPTFIIRGDCPTGYVVTLDGWNYRVTVPLQTGKPHRINYKTGRLYVNGTLTQNGIGETNTTRVPPGGLVGLGMYRIGATGTGTAEMELIDTSI